SGCQADAAGRAWPHLQARVAGGGHRGGDTGDEAGRAQTRSRGIGRRRQHAGWLEVGSRDTAAAAARDGDVKFFAEARECSNLVDEVAFGLRQRLERDRTAAAAQQRLYDVEVDRRLADNRPATGSREV